MSCRVNRYLAPLQYIVVVDRCWSSTVGKRQLSGYGCRLGGRLGAKTKTDGSSRWPTIRWINCTTTTCAEQGPHSTDVRFSDSENIRSRRLSAARHLKLQSGGGRLRHRRRHFLPVTITRKTTMNFRSIISPKGLPDCQPAAWQQPTISHTTSLILAIVVCMAMDDDGASQSVSTN